MVNRVFAIAAGEQGDACAARANGGKSAAKLSEEERIVNARKQAFAIREAEKFQYASGAGERLQAEALVKANDAREGGETAFPDLDLRVEARAGRLLMFPPYWMFQHAGLPPKSNDKYIISTYLLF